MGEKKKSSYVITAAQAVQNPYHARRFGRNSNAGRPHKEFLKSLETYSQENNSQEIIQAIRGSYVAEIEVSKFLRKNHEDSLCMETPIFRRLKADRKRERAQRASGRGNKFHYFWSEIPDYTYKTLNFKRLNKKIGIVGPKVPPQNENPTTGIKDLPQDYYGISIIAPHSKQTLSAISKDVGGKLPRLLLTTGACTYPNYNSTNSRGERAERHHQLGFCAVDVLGPKLYLPRLVPALNDGTFIDLGIKYEPGKEPVKAKTAALILGDWHLPFDDEEAKKASFEMIDHFKPGEIYIHDLLDFYSIVHHKLGDNLFQMWIAEEINKKGYDADSLEGELEIGRDFLKEISEVAGNSQIYLVASNHEQFIHKWLMDGSHLKDRKNSRLGSKIRGNYYKRDNPLEVALKQVGEIPENVHFLALDGDRRPWGYECATHGHMGPQGSRGTLKSFKASYGKGVIGHYHTLEVNGKSISVGTNSEIPLDYQIGNPSRSMHGNAVIYEKGLAQAIPIISGKWRK